VTDDIPADQTDDERRSAGLSPNALPAGKPSRGSLAPTPVKVSFWLWVAGTVVLILSQAYYLLIQNQVIDSYIARSTDVTITKEQWAASVPVLLWVVFVAAVVFGALMTLFAYKAREGTRSARSVVTVLAILTTLFYALFFVTPYALLAVLLFLIALLLMYIPTSVQTYFPKVGRKLI
jgi:hypothetical protein